MRKFTLFVLMCLLMISPVQAQSTPEPNSGAMLVFERVGDPNADAVRDATWETQEAVTAGVDYVVVPAGCFYMGMPLSGTEISNQSPQTLICFDETFLIGMYEVTNAYYAAVRAEHPELPDPESLASCEEENANLDPDAARSCINWFQANAFCETQGGRLPTEAEWEYAARGPQGFLYPWGNELVALRINALFQSTGNPEVVGSRPRNVSWVGAYDMVGNLWEWVLSERWDYPYDPFDGRNNMYVPSDTEVNRADLLDPLTDHPRGLRGGSWDNEAEKATTTYRGEGISASNFNSFGWRCVRPVTLNSLQDQGE